MLSKIEFSACRIAHRQLKNKQKSTNAVRDNPLVNTVIEQLEKQLSEYSDDWSKIDIYLTETERKSARGMARLWIQKSKQTRGLQDITNFARN